MSRKVPSVPIEAIPRLKDPRSSYLTYQQLKCIPYVAALDNHSEAIIDPDCSNTNTYGVSQYPAINNLGCSNCTTDKP